MNEKTESGDASLKSAWDRIEGYVLVGLPGLGTMAVTYWLMEFVGVSGRKTLGLMAVVYAVLLVLAAVGIQAGKRKVFHG